MSLQCADRRPVRKAFSGEISMRRTTSTAATLTVAGLAALIAGCSSSSNDAGPAVVHHAAKAAPAAVKQAAAPANPKAELAKAVRASLAAHTVQFRYRDTQTLVDRTGPENVNPFYVAAGVANFDSNLVTVYSSSGDHANQPFLPSVATVVDGSNKYVADATSVVGSGAWAKGTAGAGDAADVQITQVMQAVKGAVRIVSKTANMTQYQLQSDMSQMLIDQSGNSRDPLARSLAGTTQTENVWVNRDGLIVRARWTLDPGKVHLAGLSPSVVKAVYITIDYTNYGVDMVVPPHAA
jgi:hypothetical protein